MNAIPSDSDLHFNATAAPLELGLKHVDRLALQWIALREAGAAIAALAGGDIWAGSAEHLAFPLGLHGAHARRQVLIEQMIGDLVAVIEPGVAALLVVHERGGNAAPAARALWQEFVAARGGLLALAPTEADDESPH
jgi:hypothetical protein